MSKTSLNRDELGASFRAYERSSDKFLIGAESEKFGVHQESGEALAYGGRFSVCDVLSSLKEEHGWAEMKEGSDAPVIGLTRRGASITLEPSAQLELSGEALADLHAIRAESDLHLSELSKISDEMGIAWLTTGFHPLAKLSELSWVPKQRYPIMRSYLPKRGKGGLDMMQRTATVQGNFDWSDESDAMRKLVLALKVSPLMQAWFTNSPFAEGKVSGKMSHRAEVWRNMDPARSGLIECLWKTEAPRYQDYADWAVNAGMFLIRREGKIVLNTGQTFADFMDNGFEGHRATLDDWKLHLSTLFPEVRLKNTLEVRSVDSLPPALALASLAVWTGIFYDERALLEASQLVESFRFDQVESERGGLIEKGLHASMAGHDGFHWASRLYEIALGGLSRRDRKNEGGDRETIYLQPASDILKSRKLPAETLVLDFEKSGSLIEACRLRY